MAIENQPILKFPHLKIPTFFFRLLTKKAVPLHPKNNRMTVNYYDDYDFPEADELKFADGYDAPYNNTTGILTGTCA